MKETHAQLSNELLDHQTIVHGLQGEVEKRDEEILSMQTIYREHIDTLDRAVRVRDGKIVDM